MRTCYLPACQCILIFSDDFTGTDEIREMAASCGVLILKLMVVLVIASEYLFWTMLETGLAVVVACLPILQIWIRKISTEAVARNARGVFSMESFPQSSQRHTEHETTHPIENGNSSGGSLHHTSSTPPIELKGLDKYS